MNKISIAMTTYNGEKYIKKQLDSLIAQTRPADEVIILDDCSTDNTVNIITEFIRVHNISNWIMSVNVSNKGFIKNFYSAIERTTGNMIFLCDQDDIWHENKIEVMEKLFTEHKDAVAINTSFTFIDENDNEIYATEGKNTSNHRLIFRDLPTHTFTKFSESDSIKGNISPGCTMAFTDVLRDYYLEHASMLIPHDFEINLYAARTGSLYFYNDSLISYRIHTENSIGMDVSSKGILQKLKNIKNRKPKALKILDDEEKRVKFFKEYYITDNIRINKYISNFIKYVNIKKKCIKEHRFLVWPKMWLYFPGIRPNVSAVSVVCDLIYALKIERLF